MKKIIAIVLSLLLILLMLGGCVQTDKTLTKIRLSEVTHSIFYAPFYLAIEMGYFEEEGIEIELTNGGGSNVSMTAVVSGQAEVALVGPETAVYTTGTLGTKKTDGKFVCFYIQIYCFFPQPNT